MRLADRLRSARAEDRFIDLPRLGGVEIALKALLAQIGVTARIAREPVVDLDLLTPDDLPSLGVVLGTFKAAQLGDRRCVRRISRLHGRRCRDDGARCRIGEIVEVAADRVRDGRVTDTFASLVKPDVPITAGAVDTHGIRPTDVSIAPRFPDLWPKLAAFCGDDIVVAHNRYAFDFKILDRMVRALGKRFDLCTYDTLPLARDLFRTSREAFGLARVLRIDAGTSHRALDDAHTLAQVFLELGAMKARRARKTSLTNLLDLVGLGLALCDRGTLCAEALLFRDFCVPYTLGRYSSCLEMYERECGGDESLPGVDEVIEALGGTKLMVKLRTEKTAHERYPATMLRLQRLIAHVGDGAEPADRDISRAAALSARSDGVDVDRDRVEPPDAPLDEGARVLARVHRGGEDAQLPGRPPSGVESSPAEIEEARRLLYVGMTRAKDRLVLSRAAVRGGNPTGGHRFLDEMGLVPVGVGPPSKAGLPA